MWGLVASQTGGRFSANCFTKNLQIRYNGCDRNLPSNANGPTSMTHNRRRRIGPPKTGRLNRDRKAAEQAAATRRGLRLVLEPLECRRLLAGVNVSVFLDTGETPAAGRVVYIDQNFNGQLDTDEQVRITDTEGAAAFGGLEPGDYTLSLLTDAQFQKQTSPSRIAAVANKLSSTAAEFLVANNDGSLVWSLDGSGQMRSLRGGEPSDEPNLGIVPAQVLALGETALVLSKDSAALQQFDLESGAVTQVAIRGLDSQHRINHIERSGDGFLLLSRSVDGSKTHVASAELANGELNVGSQEAASADLLVVVPDAGYLATNSTGEGTEVVWYRPNDASQVEHRYVSTQPVESVHVSQDGALAIMTIHGGGAEVLRLSDAGLQLEALLAEASGPVDASAQAGRIVTGSQASPGELIVWDVGSWQPAGRSQVTVASETPRISSLLRIGSDQVWVAGSGGVHSAELGVADSVVVSVGAEPVDVQFGVEIVGENQPPQVVDLAARSFDEDTLDEWMLSGAEQFIDPDDDSLWYSVAQQPEHGALAVTPRGTWTYLPNENYSGPDEASIWVHDGVNSTEVLVRLDVQPVNDLPQRLFFDIPAIAENADVGSLVGYVSIVDVDKDAEYHVTTSDPRFIVENGRIFLDGPVNFEDGGELEIEFLATDVSDSQIKIGTSHSVEVLDANDAPTKLTVENLVVDEASQGAAVGTVLVEDEDAASDYAFVVSDPRFVVDGGVLKLAPGQELDREQEPTVTLEITATDTTEPDHSISTEVTVSVADRNDPPTDIVLSRSEVEASMPGAVVGTLSVVDQDKDAYTFSVSDSRFEISGDVLQLRYDVALDLSNDSAIPVEVTARAVNGDEATGQFSIKVIEFSPFQNPRIHNDVNGDGVVSPLDILLLINLLNREGYELGTPPGVGGGSGEPDGAIYPDVNGDNRLSPLDVLLIINHLNANRGDGEGEYVGGQSLADSSTQVVDYVYGPTQTPIDVDALERQRRQLRDQQLEQIIAQLSSGR